MNEPRDGWDADERDALDGLEDELAELRAKHAGDPPLDVLRAADANALPEEMQEQVANHLHSSAWSRALVEGLRDAHPDDHLDRDSEQRMLDRIMRQAEAETPRRRWGLAIAAGGFAIAATLLLAVLVSRRPAETLPSDVAATRNGDVAGSPVAKPVAPILIAYTKPEVKLSAAALTWRGDAENPLLRDLAPAIEAYRASDYTRAVAAFDKLAPRYPGVIEVLFYQGVSRMLAGDDAGAVAPLTAAAALEDPTFIDDVSWYLAVAQQRSGKGEPGRLFDQLCSGGREYAAAACKAAAELDRASRQP